MATKPDYAGDLLAACCGNALHLWRPKINGESEDKAVPSDRTVVAAAWNRNNKVVASAREDGSIELRYSNGALMTVLPKGGAAPGSRPCRSLAWSMGSKRLAAASQDGSVYLHDMTAKTCTPLFVSSSPLSAVAFHPDDRFLATAGRSISLYSVQTLSSFGDLTLDLDASGFTSLAVAAGQPAVAAGTSCGCVAVWDYKTKQQLHVDTSRHIGGTVAVQFAPLDPGVLYSIGKDGALLMQDLRAGPFHVPTARIGAGAGLTSLSIREDFKYITAGTADGRVLLYDPRYCAAPATTLRCGDPLPVTSLHWQHNYQSLTSRAREAAASAAAEGSLPAGRITVMAPMSSSSSESSANAGGTGGGGVGKEPSLSFAAGGGGNIGSSVLEGARPSFGGVSGILGTTPGSASRAAAARNRLSFASSIATSHLEPPRKLDLSPMVSLRTVGADAGAGTTSSAAAAAAVSKLRQELAAAAAAKAPAVVAPVPEEEPAAAGASPSRSSSSAAISLDGPIQARAASPPPAAEESLSLRCQTHSPQNVHSSAAPSWRIPAVGTPRAADLDGQNGFNHRSTEAAEEESNRFEFAPNRRTLGGDGNAECVSPTKLPLERVTAHTTPAAAASKTPIAAPAAATAVLSSDASHSLHQDILALHLDMLNQFKEQQDANNALIAGVMARQEALSEEVAALRRELANLLTRRDGMLWL